MHTVFAHHPTQRDKNGPDMDRDTDTTGRTDETAKQTTNKQKQQRRAKYDGGLVNHAHSTKCVAKRTGLYCSAPSCKEFLRVSAPSAPSAPSILRRNSENEQERPVLCKQMLSIMYRSMFSCTHTHTHTTKRALLLFLCCPW